MHKKSPFLIGIMVILCGALLFWIFFESPEERTRGKQEPIQSHESPKTQPVPKNEGLSPQDAPKKPEDRSIIDRFKFLAGRQTVEKFDYLFSNDSSFELDMPEQGKERKSFNHAVRCDGNLRITCYRTDGKKGFLGYRLDRFSISVSADNREAELPQAVKDDFGTEVFLEKNDLGEIEGVYFSDLNGLVKNFWQQLFYVHHLVFSQDDPGKWVYKGENPLGTYLAAFEKKGVPGGQVISREIKNYTNIKLETGERFKSDRQTQKMSKDHFKIDILESKARYWFDSEKGFPGKIELVDAAELQVKTDFKMISTYKTTWNSEVKESQQKSPKELSELLASRWGTSDVEALKVKIGRSPLGKSYIPEPIHSEEEKAKAQEKFMEILGNIRAMAENWDARTASKLFQEAASLARISPKILDFIMEQLKESGNMQVKGFLADVLADVGSQKAQEMMKSLFTDRSIEEALRDRVLFSAAFVSSPQVFFRDSVCDIFKTSPDDSESKRLALRTMGAMAHKFKDSDPEIAQEMFDRFSSYKESASSVEEKMAFIDALGNTHLEKALPLLNEYLEKTEPLNVRMAAIATIAGQDSESALNLAIGRLETSYESQITGVALDVLVRKRWDTCSAKSKDRLLQLTDQLIERYKNNEEIRELAKKLRQSLLQ